MGIHSPLADYSYTFPVLMRCPVTGNLASTGIYGQDVDELPSDNLLRDCPECGADHFWNPDEATLAYARP